ncbi:hypothetical protein FB567DRAFT_521741 [Paraphoma chrysanthemicola]|uniref:Uncharacterized protein n=1 Tax=Paraphoma chrysanthemicola TaxID=798071 RepID=A0A8K0W0Z9_9PLEO|nr:hypothetical protein FB567DRAFT_521741 [Paraphoma chrysanthemicola]
MLEMDGDLCNQCDYPNKPSQKRKKFLQRGSKEPQSPKLPTRDQEESQSRDDHWLAEALDDPLMFHLSHNDRVGPTEPETMGMHKRPSWAHPQTTAVEEGAESRCSCSKSKPCTKKSQGCGWCQFGRAKNMVLLKKLEGYEKKHAPMQQRNDHFVYTLMIFAFFYWLSSTLFAEQMFCLVASWVLLAVVSARRRSILIEQTNIHQACCFSLFIIDQEYVERGVRSSAIGWR